MKTTDNMKKLMIQSSEIAAVMNRDEEFYGGVVGQSRGERTGQADARTEKDSERAVKRADKTTSKAKRSHKYRDFKGDSDGEKDYKKAFKADKSVIIGEDKTNFMTENMQNEAYSLQAGGPGPNTPPLVTNELAQYQSGLQISTAPLNLTAVS